MKKIIVVIALVIATSWSRILKFGIKEAKIDGIQEKTEEMEV